MSIYDKNSYNNSERWGWLIKNVHGRWIWNESLLKEKILLLTIRKEVNSISMKNYLSKSNCVTVVCEFIFELSNKLSNKSTFW